MQITPPNTVSTLQISVNPTDATLLAQDARTILKELYEGRETDNTTDSLSDQMVKLLEVLELLPQQFK